MIIIHSTMLALERIIHRTILVTSIIKLAHVQSAGLFMTDCSKRLQPSQCCLAWSAINMNMATSLKFITIQWINATDKPGEFFQDDWRPWEWL